MELARMQAADLAQLGKELTAAAETYQYHPNHRRALAPALEALVKRIVASHEVFADEHRKERFGVS